MTETWRPPAVHRSVFAKLVLVMLAMALCLVGMVVAFFNVVVSPTVGASVDRILGDYTSRIAASSPGRAEAQRLSERLGVQIGYEGPNGAWATHEGLPDMDAVERWQAQASLFGHSHYVARAPGGGRYLVAWSFGRTTHEAHDTMLRLLLASMLLVFLIAHLVLSRALRPLRALHEGVGRLSAGDLDVELPARSRDEFGTLTAAFNHMARRVREMVRARDQLLLDVSHELRSPLTRLKVALALLPDSARKHQAEADAAEMETMIAELLEFERLKDGRTRRMSVDLVEVARQAARGYEEGAPGLRLSADPASIVAELDADAMLTVFRNLLGNAVKYSLPDSRAVDVSLTRRGDAVVIRVADDGPGIPEADIPNLFEPFFRVDRSRSRKTGGYGLGLSICKRIVEAHGGTLWAANTPPRGACFTVTLPATAPRGEP
jgi:signal transduction histidine kinase